MSKHYDIAIVGSSLAAQISAALLVKQGGRVLFLSETRMKAPTWFHSSLFLEKILGVLGGRFLEGAARQPELIPMLRTQFFIVMGLTDAVPMIAVGLGLYVLFALGG